MVGCSSRFLDSSTKNLKLAGIKGLLYLTKVNKSYLTDHQITVIDCLDDNDETLRTMTLELLTTTSNTSNVTAVVDKILKCAEYDGINIECDVYVQIVC